MNEIIHGDCIEVMKGMPDKSVDLVVTSPPYDNLRIYGGNLSWDFEKIAKELFRLVKDGGIVVWIVGDGTTNGSETGTSFKQALFFKEIGFNLHDTMIWRKPNPMPQIDKSRYTQQFEYMFVFSKGKPKTTNIDVEPTKYAGKILKTHTTNPESIRKKNVVKPTKDYKLSGNVWDVVLAGTNYGHPAIFPEELVKRHVLSWSNENNLVLDPFAGSCTTLIACKQSNRRCICIEKEGDYVKIGRERFASMTNPML